MRIESSVTSLSWIPSEAVTGLNKAIFGTGFTHYDDPPPDQLGDLEALRAADRFRFANHLVGWIEVVDGKIVDAGYDGGCLMGATTVAVGPKQATFAAVAFDDIRQPVELTPDIGPLRADRRRPHGSSGTAQGQQATRSSNSRRRPSGPRWP